VGQGLLEILDAVEAGGYLGVRQRIDDQEVLIGPGNAIIDSIVAQLIVRNIDTEVVRALKLRAARHGRSAEAEHREILREVLLRRPEPSLKEHLLRMPDVGDDGDFLVPRLPARRVDL